MKKKSLFKTALFALFLAGSQVAFAQANLDAEPISPELKTTADQIIGLMSSDPDKANKEVTSLTKKKKEVELTSVGRYFYDAKQLPLAKIVGEAAYDKKPTYLPALNLLGETYLKLGDLGRAGQKYDEILTIEPNEKSVMLKTADVYRKVNPEVAKEIMHKVKEVDPGYYQADRDLAALYYSTNDVSKAIEHYDLYFKAYPKGDAKSRQDLAVLLFLSGEFDRSLTTVNEALKENPNDVALTRMKFFDLYELGRYNEAKEAMDSHISKYNDTLYNYSDYLYMGKLHDNLGDAKSAITAYEKSVKLNPDNAEAYKSLSDAYKSADDYANAIVAYKTYMEKLGDKAVIRDNLVFGRLYYSAAQAEKDEAVKTQYIADGVKQFQEVETRVPDNYNGPFWLARINILSNPNEPQDIVKEYYEKTLKVLENSDNKAVKVECYNYFTFYSIHHDDNASARQYNAKALEIEPDNALALQIYEALKSMK